MKARPRKKMEKVALDVNKGCERSLDQAQTVPGCTAPLQLRSSLKS
jgi:hypothetical protein